MSIRFFGFVLSVGLLGVCAAHAGPAPTAAEAVPAGDANKQRIQFVETAARLRYHVMMFHSEPYYCRHETVIAAPFTEVVCLNEAQMAAKIRSSRRELLTRDITRLF